jgi:L-amino acid N-acyltransferase YncA
LSWTIDQGFQLREMKPEDLTLVWKWRNHERVRSVSNSQETIAWEDHLRWFCSTPQTKKFVMSEQGKTVGVVTLNEKGYWSFYLDPELPRRKGYGLVMLSIFLAKCKQMGVQILRAQVRRENAASLKLHKQIGFRVTGLKAGIYELLYTAKDNKTVN